MSETVHTYEIYRIDSEGSTETYEEVFSNRETAESVRDALNAVLAHDTYEKGNDKWAVVESTINHAAVKYVPVFVRTVVTNAFGSRLGNPEFSSMNQGHPVKAGTELPATEFSVDFRLARVYGFTFEEATANGEKAIEKMKAQQAAVASK